MYSPNFLPVQFKLGLYPIVDNVTWIERLAKLGVRIIQLRIKCTYENEIESQISTAVTLSNYYNLQLFINDHWNLAIKYQAYGVHLGQEDLKSADLNAIRKAQIRLGISAYNDIEINAALISIRPSYISLGHVFSTKTKQIFSSPQGLYKLRYYVKCLENYPTVAIGGINLERASSVLKTGVGGIAVSSAITKTTSWKKTTKQLLTLVRTNEEQKINT